MKVTPLDIRRKEFKRSMRGYADEEVDIFLDEVADEFERLYQENAEMQDKLQHLEEQLASHAQLKAALEKTLVSAQLQADQMTANARKESELIMRDAELKARDIVSESYSETQRVQQTLVQLKHLEEDFRFKFRSLLEAHLKLLNDAPIAVQGSDTAVLAPTLASDKTALTPAEVRTSPEAMAQDAPPPAPEAAPVNVPDLSDTEELLDATVLVPPPAPEAGRPEATDGVLPRVERTITYRRASVWPGEESAPATVDAPSTAVAAGAAIAGEAAAREDDVPTQETPGFVAETVAGSEDSAAKAAVADEAVPEAAAAPPVDATPSAETEADDTATSDAYTDDSQEQPVRGFFFGKRLEDLDDSFVTSETLKNEKGRDFEW